MNIHLNNQIAIVCGSSQGIGLASAQAIAELGASIVMVARDESRLKSAIDTLATSANQRHRYFLADFVEIEAVRGVAQRIGNEFPEVHILVNNTGGPPAGTALDASTADFQAAFGSHLLANQMFVQAISPKMKRQRYGRIINIISTSVKQPIPGLGVSNTIRGTVASWAKTLSFELGPFNITVNNILPGFTSTGRLASLIQTKADRAGISTDAVAKEMTREVPLGRFADPSEVAAAVAFLASPAASYISGVSLPIDGGRTTCI